MACYGCIGKLHSHHTLNSKPRILKQFRVNFGCLISDVLLAGMLPSHHDHHTEEARPFENCTHGHTSFRVQGLRFKAESPKSSSINNLESNNLRFRIPPVMNNPQSLHRMPTALNLERTVASARNISRRRGGHST